MKKKAMLKTAVSVCLVAVISYYSFWKYNGQVLKSGAILEDQHQKTIADKDSHDSEIKKSIPAESHGPALKPVFEGSLPENK